MKPSIITLALGQLGQRIINIMTAGDRVLPLDRYDVDTTNIKECWAPLHTVTVDNQKKRSRKIEPAPIVNM